jgi:hypothetical protein
MGSHVCLFAGRERFEVGYVLDNYFFGELVFFVKIYVGFSV